MVDLAYFADSVLEVALAASAAAKVVEKRARDERPGRHEAILTGAEYRRTKAAIAARTRTGNKPAPFRAPRGEGC